MKLDRSAVRFPVELRLPPGFDASVPATWPRVDGHLEYVNGRLLFMPPSGDEQQDVAIDVALVLGGWSEQQTGFVVGGNEAGMLLGGEVRAADVAVWRRDQTAPRTGGYRRVAPILAVEIAGQEDDEASLREKAQWYLAHGVEAVWLVLPTTRDVVVLTTTGEWRGSGDAAVPAPAALPGLAPTVDRFFAQLSR